MFALRYVKIYYGRLDMVKYKLLLNSYKILVD